jgi:hypothetical protein
MSSKYSYRKDLHMDTDHSTTDYDDVIVRTRDAGVFAGRLVLGSPSTHGRIHNARRLWYWDGAASLSELATLGTSNPKDCKFPAAVEWIDVAGIVEVLPVTAAARLSIDGVAVWTRF